MSPLMFLLYYTIIKIATIATIVIYGRIYDIFIIVYPRASKVLSPLSLILSIILDLLNSPKYNL